LDLCCGQGNVATALAARGCIVTGADFSPAMLALARRRLEGAVFVEADAQDLPFGDGTFDAVVSNFGINHVPVPERALAEVRRVLRKGGRFGMTVWCGPDQSPALEVFFRVVRGHGAAGIAPPPAPDFYQFANRMRAQEMLSAVGFSDIDFAIRDSGWTI